MKVLGLIPARGGSLRLPNKNLEQVGGVSLIARAIDSAMACPALDHVAVSTDSQRIAVIAGVAGVTLIDRPPELSKGDQPHMLSVVRHALDLMPGFDAVVLLQPTSPFRTKDDISKTVFALETFDAVVSVTDPEPYSVFYRSLDGKQLMRGVPFFVVPNGAIYAMKTQAVAEGRHWYDGQVFGYWMPRERSIDINSHADLILARSMVEHG